MLRLNRIKRSSIYSKFCGFPYITFCKSIDEENFILKLFSPIVKQYSLCFQIINVMKSSCSKDLLLINIIELSIQITLN